MNKRELLLHLLKQGKQIPYTPAAFFLHFDPAYHRGKAAIDKHLEFYRFTGMDLLKIQYELSFPPILNFSSPAQWSMIPVVDENFFYDQWNITEGLVRTVGKETLVLMTLYSPFMCVGQIVGDKLLVDQINKYPEEVKKGMEIVTENLLTFARGCIHRGIDGFYHSTQGAETYRFGKSPLFEDVIKPYDLALMFEVNQRCKFNILHICDYHGKYSDYSTFLDYPGDIINCSLSLDTEIKTGNEISTIFGRPFMGGLERHGVIVSGSKEDIQGEVQNIIQNSPEAFILGADCTLPGNIDWENIKAAISFAHNYVRL